MLTCYLGNMEEGSHRLRVVDSGQSVNPSAGWTVRTADQRSRFLKLAVRHASGRGGFSLVEIVLSLGIISVALVALLGLLPVGIQTFEAALDGTIEAQISQTIVAQVRQAKFSDLSKLAARTFHFDDQGNLIVDKGGEPAADPNSVYEATIRINYEQDLPVRNVPTGGSNYYEKANLAVTTVKVIKISDPKHPFVWTAYVSNCGH